MEYEAFLAMANALGLSVERIEGGYTLDLEGTPHSIRSAMLTDYGLTSTSEPEMRSWLSSTYHKCKAIGLIP